MSKILFFYVLRSFAVPALICLFGLCALTLLFMSFDLIGACFDAESVVTWRVATSSTKVKQSVLSRHSPSVNRVHS